jgi:DHA3 family macrolide efflux protein-like MFS transporter
MSETVEMTKWKVRFFTIWTGQAFSLFGSSLISFSLVWWLTQETGSTTILAIGTLVTMLPPIVLGPFAGTLVDRWSRRAVMIIADTFIALITLGLMILFGLGLVDPWHLFVVMFLRSLGGAFHSPAMMAATTLMVPKEQLTRVGGMNQTLGGLVRVVAPPAGAFLIGLLPMHWVLSVDLLTAALAVLPLLFVHIPHPVRIAAGDEKPSVLREMVAGLHFVWSWRPLFFIVFTCTLANIFLGPAISFRPLLITQDFGGGALQLGYVSSASGIGVIVGGFVMSLWGGFKRKLITSATGWIGIGAGYVAIAFIPGAAFYGFLGLMFFIGFMTPVGCAPLDAFYQSCIPPDKQGRVFSVLASMDGMSMPFGIVIAGVLGGIVPLRVWYFLVGASHVLLGISWMFLRFIRHAEDHPPRGAIAGISVKTSLEPRGDES